MKEYIEREAAIQALGDEPEIWCERDPIEIQEQNDWNYYKHCIEAVPTADVVEVRHGRWIEDERTYPGPGLKNNLCSVCGEIAGSWKEGLEPGRKWAYCPNCGARMGKEDEHEIG